MRPTFTYFLVACLALLSANSVAQNASDNPAAGKAQEEQKILTKEELAEARQLARADRAREQERERYERERLCVIKPVMTDAQIAQCKEVWR